MELLRCCRTGANVAMTTRAVVRRRPSKAATLSRVADSCMTRNVVGTARQAPGVYRNSSSLRHSLSGIVCLPLLPHNPEHPLPLSAATGRGERKRQKRSLNKSIKPAAVHPQNPSRQVSSTRPTNRASQRSRLSAETQRNASAETSTPQMHRIAPHRAAEGRRMRGRGVPTPRTCSGTQAGTQRGACACA